MPSSDVWLSWNSFAEIGIVGRGHLGHGLADADLTLNSKVSRRLRRSFNRDGQLIAEACVVPVRVWPLTERLASKRSPCGRAFLRPDSRMSSTAG